MRGATFWSWPPWFSHSANSCSAAPGAPNQGDLWAGSGVGGGRPGALGGPALLGHDPQTPMPHRTTIWTHRVRFLEEWALPHWATFTIWNAGRQGRRLYRSLTAGSRCKVGPTPCPTPPPSSSTAPTAPEAGVLGPPQVVAFCDVDENKIKKGFYCYEDSQVRPLPTEPPWSCMWSAAHTALWGAVLGLLSRHCPEPSSLGKAIWARTAARPGRCSPQAPGVSRTPEGTRACPHLPLSLLEGAPCRLGSVRCPPQVSPVAAIGGWVEVLETRSSPGSGCGPGACLRASSFEQGRGGGLGSKVEQPVALLSSQERPKPRVPVLHFRAAQPPFVICVKLVSVRLGHVWLGQPQGQEVVCCVHQEAAG